MTNEEKHYAEKFATICKAVAAECNEAVTLHINDGNLGLAKTVARATYKKHLIRCNSGDLLEWLCYLCAETAVRNDAITIAIARHNTTPPPQGT